jgi:hypothetical protein
MLKEVINVRLSWQDTGFIIKGTRIGKKIRRDKKLKLNS